MHHKTFFEPIKLTDDITLKNRFVMAPMTRKLTPKGIPNEDLVTYYELRAKGGLGLIITEGITVSHQTASNSVLLPDFTSVDKISGWKKVVEAVHRHDTKIIAQIWHVGSSRDPKESPFPNTESIDVNTVSESTIQDLIKSFADTSKIAKEIGFDGVEIHAAHGYLIDEFLWKGTNHRTDSYGGNISKRTKFLNEIVENCRKETGKDFLITVRISQWKISNFEAKIANNPSELEELINSVSDEVDVFHCSTRRFWQAEFEGSELNLAGWVKRISSKPTITVGSVGLNGEFLAALIEGKGAELAKIDLLTEKMKNKEFDMVALGRAVIANPNWVNLLRENKQDEMISFDANMLQTL